MALPYHSTHHRHKHGPTNSSSLALVTLNEGDSYHYTGEKEKAIIEEARDEELSIGRGSSDGRTTGDETYAFTVKSGRTGRASRTDEKIGVEEEQCQDEMPTGKEVKDTTCLFERLAKTETFASIRLKTQKEDSIQSRRPYTYKSAPTTQSATLNSAVFHRLSKEHTSTSFMRRRKVYKPPTPIQIVIASCSNDTKKVQHQVAHGHGQSIFHRLSRSETFTSASRKEKFNPKQRSRSDSFVRRKHQKTKTTQSFFDKMAISETFASVKLKAGKKFQRMS